MSFSLLWRKVNGFFCNEHYTLGRGRKRIKCLEEEENEKNCKTKPMGLFLVPREVPQMCMLIFFQKIIHWTSFNVERKSAGKEWMVVEKNMLNFFWHWKKIGRFVFCKVKFRWRRIKATNKDEDEEKEEKGCRKIAMELLSVPREAPWVCFMY